MASNVLTPNLGSDTDSSSETLAGSAVQTASKTHDEYCVTMLWGSFFEPESWPKKDRASNWMMGPEADSSILDRHLSNSSAPFSCLIQLSLMSTSMHCMILEAIRKPSVTWSSSTTTGALRSHKIFKHVICMFLYKSLVEPNSFWPDGVSHCCTSVWVETGWRLVSEAWAGWMPSGCSTIMTMPHSHNSSMADSPDTLFCKMRHSSVSKRRLAALGRRR